MESAHGVQGVGCAACLAACDQIATKLDTLHRRKVSTTSKVSAFGSAYQSDFSRQIAQDLVSVNSPCAHQTG